MIQLTPDLFSLDLPSIPELDNLIAAEANSARAHKTRVRVQARRAAGEEKLAEILPADIADGDAWHVISSGDVDAMSFLAHLLTQHQMDYVAFSTWCMALDDVDRLERWLSIGRIRRLDAYVGEIFPGSYTKEHTALCDVLRRFGGRCAVFRNHSKMFLCRSGDRAWVIESSANINTNPRAENTVITADRGLFDHHKQYLDRVRSYVRDFDDWTPAQ